MLSTVHDGSMVAKRRRSIWARAYRDDEYNVAVNTSSVVEALYRVLKCRFLPSHKNPMNLSTESQLR